MRIVAGAWRGRQIKAPSGDLVRPTGDRVREAWMSIVNASLPDASVLDLFAGSGALGLESLSRGAREAHFVENAAKSLQVIAANIRTLDAGDRAIVHRADAVKFLDKLGAEHFDVAFADPPYDKGLATAVAERWLVNPFADLIGIEHRRDEKLPGEPEVRQYGGTSISFYRVDVSSRA
jgi:16S rRNA (guanine966-N2)-methyltransferase